MLLRRGLVIRVAIHEILAIVSRLFGLFKEKFMKKILFSGRQAPCLAIRGFVVWCLFVLGILGISATLSSSLFAAEKPYEPLQFTVHTQTIGPVTLQLGKMDVVSELNVPQTLPVVISSTADKPLPATLTFYSCDTVSPFVDGKCREVATRSVEIPAKGSVETEFQFALLPGTYSAHYPLHVKCVFPNGERDSFVHAVRVIETKVAAQKKADEKVVVKIGGVSLIGKAFTASRTFNGQLIPLPDFDGSDPVSHATFNYSYYSTGGIGRQCVNSHPPYVPGGGSFFAEYEVELPNESGLSMNYGVCVRKVFPPEPPTDGVTFRFWAKNVGDDDSKRVLLHEVHTKSTEWEDYSFSLEKFAGSKMNLVVEVNPGPKNNTTCDGCFISGLTINSDRGVKFNPEKAYGKPLVLPLDKEFQAQITPGANGLLDAKIAIGNPAKPDSFVAFDGITLAVGNQQLNDSSAVFTKAPELKRLSNGKLLFSCVLLTQDQEFPVKIYIYPENGTLVFDVPKDNPAELANFAFRPADQDLRRVYWGHGFVAEKPGAFRIGMGGHDLAASHIGMDFENGTSLLMGASNAPVAFVCDGEKKVCTLEMSSWFKLALVPDSQNAFNAAFKYRKQNSWLPKTGPGVERKRGRLTFDVWGGSYANNTKDLQKAALYGVNDALFIKHCWQRWGYDVRLPDLWDTNPDAKDLILGGLGTYEELKELAETCAALNIPFGVHDNYIDFYPDADDFSYDRITFHSNGTPRKAWINHGAGVQSYQWRPDLFKPFLERNLALDRKYLPTMDAYFVDVFTSANVCDFWDRDGNFHPRTETAKYWKDCFETIAQGLSHDVNGKKEAAITVSEAGSDGLLGSISGADCQWMLIDSESGGPWRRHVPCESWARTPWFAAVNHTNFSRHGAGYSGRYVALRDGVLHDAMSDDYISSELLGGLDLMVEAGTVFPGSVRKHYLAQHVVRALADQEIVGVKFVKGNLRRQCVTWTNGMKVFVNRDAEDWTVKGHLLPKFGFIVLDAEGKVVSGIVRNPANTKEIVEFSKRADGGFYLNARSRKLVDILPIQPTMKSAKVLEDGRAFEVVTNWFCAGPAPKDLGIFAHVFEPARGYGFTPTGWYDGYSSSIPTSQWGKDETTRNIETGAGHVFRVPEDARNGKYHVMVGLWDARGTQKRFALMGESAQAGRYSVAEFEIRDGKIVGEIKPVKVRESFDDFSRLLGNKTPMTLNGVSTLGAVFVEPIENGLEILPLPFADNFDVTVNRPIKRVLFDGKEVPFKMENGAATFSATVEDAKRYRVEF